MRMSKNRIQVREYLTYYTYESIADGESDRSKLDDERIFDNLSDFADYLVDTITYHWLCEAGYDGLYGELYTNSHMTGEQAERYVCWKLGERVDTELNRIALKIRINRALERKQASASLIRAFNQAF